MSFNAGNDVNVDAIITMGDSISTSQLNLNADNNVNT